jgi:hypothetical protein
VHYCCFHSTWPKAKIHRFFSLGAIQLPANEMAGREHCHKGTSLNRLVALPP